MTASAPPPDHDDDALTGLVTQLLRLTGATASIVDHMQAWAASGHSAPDAPPIPDVLTTLLHSALGPLVQRYPRDALETSAALLEDAVELVVAEVLLVPLSPPTGPFSRLRARRRPSSPGGGNPPHPP